MNSCAGAQAIVPRDMGYGEGPHSVSSGGSRGATDQGAAAGEMPPCLPQNLQCLLPSSLGFPVLGKRNVLPSHSPTGAQEPVESLSHPKRLSGEFRATQCPGVQ